MLHSKLSVSIVLYFYDIYIYIHDIIATQNSTQTAHFWRGNNKCKVIRWVKNGYKMSQNIRLTKFNNRLNPFMDNGENWPNIL